MPPAPSRPSPRFKLSIWRPYVPGRRLMLFDEDGPRLLDTDSSVLEKVYSWTVREEPFAGISDEDLRAELKQHFHERLGESRQPSERDISVLGEFLALARTAIDSGKVKPCPSQSDSDASDVQPDFNGLLALVLHLEWLAACFRHRPGVSVLVK